MAKRAKKVERAKIVGRLRSWGIGWEVNLCYSVLFLDVLLFPDDQILKSLVFYKKVRWCNTNGLLNCIFSQLISIGEH
jgi:hypothetical protein